MCLLAPVPAFLSFRPKTHVLYKIDQRIMSPHKINQSFCNRFVIYWKAHTSRKYSDENVNMTGSQFCMALPLGLHGAFFLHIYEAGLTCCLGHYLAVFNVLMNLFILLHFLLQSANRLSS